MGFAVLVSTIDWTDSTAWATVVGAMMLAPVVLLARHGRRLRAGAWGLITGVGLPIVAILIAEAMTKLL